MEAQSAPLNSIHVEARSGDPSAVAGASILASLSSFKKDLSLLPPPAKTAEDVQNTEICSLPSVCDGSDDPDVELKDTTSNNDLSSRGKTVNPTSDAANENPNLDSIGLNSCVNAEIGKLPASTCEIRPLLQMLAGSSSSDFDISGSISKMLDDQRELRELFKESGRSMVLIS